MVSALAEAKQIQKILSEHHEDTHIILETERRTRYVLSVVWWTNLCGGSWVVLSGQELMKMTGVGISFASQTKLRTHMLIG